MHQHWATKVKEMRHTFACSTRNLFSLPGPLPLQTVLATGGSWRCVLPHPHTGYMHALVPLEVAERAAGKSAAVTFVRFFPRVNAKVSLEVHQLSRGVRAQRAVKRLLPIVRLHVALHVVGVTRGESAEMTRVHFSRFVLGCQRLVTHPISHLFAIKLHIRTWADTADASKRWAEVRTLSFPRGFATSKAVRANEVNARSQRFITELSAAPAGQVRRETGLRLGRSAFVFPPIVRRAARVVRFTFHAQLAVSRTLITQRIHGETDLGSNFCAGKTREIFD